MLVFNRDTNVQTNPCKTPPIKIQKIKHKRVGGEELFLVTTKCTMFPERKIKFPYLSVRGKNTKKHFTEYS